MERCLTTKALLVNIASETIEDVLDDRQASPVAGVVQGRVAILIGHVDLGLVDVVRALSDVLPFVLVVLGHAEEGSEFLDEVLPLRQFISISENYLCA
jgi:hypothetical protein